METRNKNRVRSAESGPAAIIKNQNVSLTWEPLGDHMGVMLPDDLSQRPMLPGRGVVRSHPPDNLAALLVGDTYDVGIPGTPDNVVGVEALVPRVIPLIGTEVRHTVDM